MKNVNSNEQKGGFLLVVKFRNEKSPQLKYGTLCIYTFGDISITTIHDQTLFQMTKGRSLSSLQEPESMLSYYRLTPPMHRLLPGQFLENVGFEDLQVTHTSNNSRFLHQKSSEHFWNLQVSVVLTQPEAYDQVQFTLVQSKGWKNYLLNEIKIALRKIGVPDKNIDDIANNLLKILEI